jgi:hypothetical protein
MAAFRHMKAAQDWKTGLFANRINTDNRVTELEFQILCTEPCNHHNDKEFTPSYAFGKAPDTKHLLWGIHPSAKEAKSPP